MRIRSIKPDFWSSESIAALSRSARLTFIGVWSYVDDNGVGVDNEKLIVSALFPLEIDDPETLATLSRDLRELCSAGRISRYRVNGKRYLHVTNWNEHQKIDRPGKARHPTPDHPEAVVFNEKNSSNPGRDETPSRDFREGVATLSMLEKGEGSRENGSGDQGIREVPTTPAEPGPSAQVGLPGIGLHPAPKPAPRAAPKLSPDAPTTRVWMAYSAAYLERYGVNPVRNAAVNGQLGQFVARVGAEDAPAIAANYLRSNNAFYVQNGHSVGLLLRDYEKLRTEWLTGRATTRTQAQQIDRTGSNAFAQLAEQGWTPPGTRDEENS